MLHKLSRPYFEKNLCDASWYGRYFNWPAFGETAIENNLTAVAAALLFVFWSILRNARDNQGLLYMVAKYPEGEIIIIIWFTTEVALVRQERVWARARKKYKAPAKRKRLCACQEIFAYLMSWHWKQSRAIRRRACLLPRWRRWSFPLIFVYFAGQRQHCISGLRFISVMDAGQKVWLDGILNKEINTQTLTEISSPDNCYVCAREFKWIAFFI